MTGQARQPTSASPASPEAGRWLDLATVERSVLDLRPDYTAGVPERRDRQRRPNRLIGR